MHTVFLLVWRRSYILKAKCNLNDILTYVNLLNGLKEYVKTCKAEVDIRETYSSKVGSSRKRERNSLLFTE